MKKLILIVLFFCPIMAASILAQGILPDTPNAFITPYELEVGYNTTTVLIFPAALIPASDRGSRDIIIEQEEQLGNILKVKAATKSFSPTNLHIFTADGGIYVFNVRYTEYPTHTTFILPARDALKAANKLVIKTEVLTDNQLREMANTIRYAGHFFSRKSTKEGITLQLKTIYHTGDWLFFGLEIANESSLDFDIDFMRLYIRDQRKMKRSSMQEQEIVPVYKDSLTSIPGFSSQRIVLAVRRFTIPENKEFFIEVYEKNGGRYVTLKVKNRHLLKSRKI